LLERNFWEIIARRSALKSTVTSILREESICSITNVPFCVSVTASREEATYCVQRLFLAYSTLLVALRRNHWINAFLFVGVPVCTWNPIRALST
ncbi:unnamed protein product, partial [Heterotrigona itama]